MRRRDLIGTTMALTLAVFMSAVITGCSSEEAPVMETVISTETETETLEEGYKDIMVTKEYAAVLISDKPLTDTPDGTATVKDLEKDTYVTVFATVEFNGVSVDYYHVKTEDGTSGYIEGKYLDFNVSTESDYVDDLKAVEGGDGGEATTSTANTDASNSSGVSEDAFTPYTMYTNTACNVRSQPDKNSDLVGTCEVNTEVTVIGIDGDWSKISYKNMEAFCKSSLLSKNMTEVPKSNSNSTGNQNNTGGAGNQSNAGNSNSSDGNWDFLDDYPSSDDMANGGGGTGATTDGSLGGAE